MGLSDVHQVDTEDCVVEFSRRRCLEDVSVPLNPIGRVQWISQERPN